MAGFMVTKHPHNSRGWGFYRIPHNDQAIKHQAGTGSSLPHPWSNLRFLQGKNMTMGKYKMSSSKQLQACEWQVLWLMLTPSTPPLPWQHEQLNQETQYGQRLINEETQSTGKYCQRGRNYRVWPMEKLLPDMAPADKIDYQSWKEYMSGRGRGAFHSLWLWGSVALLKTEV